jgi:hypothetical protein
MNWPEEAAAVPLEPVAHESRQAIVERAYFFSAIYAFEVDGHGYELANAIDANRSDNIYELVFIDGELACSRDRVVRSVSDLDSDVTAWEWVSEPEGLEYLADRLRIGCGLAAWTPPKVWVAIPTPQPAIGADSVLAADSAQEKDEAVRDAAAIAGGVAYVGLAFIPVFGPLIQLLFAGAASVENPPQTSGSDMGVDDGYAKLRSSQSPEELLASLGDPDVVFELPKVGVQVRAFRLQDVHPYYVGVLDGRPVWFHAEYPWLKQLAMEALGAETKERRNVSRAR